MTPIVSFFLRSDGEEEENGDREILITFFCDAYLSAVVRWLEDGCRMTPKEFVGNLKAMILEMARKIVEEKV